MTRTILLIACTGIALAQSKPQQPPRFRTEANFVRVDVYATQAGRPLTDLRLEDFEVLEDGVAQAISTFERISVRAPGAQAPRAEPTSERESLDRAERSRVSVIFLDRAQMGVDGSHRIREPLLRFIDRAFGDDDLIGIMTADMAASQVVLAKKHEVIAKEFRDNPFFGFQGPFGDDNFDRDERERAYRMCYPESQFGPLAKQMIDRRRERMTLSAFEDLARYLRHVREERKAIIVISQGWRLYTPDDTLTRLAKYEAVPGVDQMYVGPGGKITRRNPSDMADYSKYDCDADRIALAQMNNEQYLRDIVGEANRANASFYTMDPRGLVATFTHGEYMAVKDRHDAMRDLAGGTDGLAILNSNDLDAGLRRVADDLSSYYLLGYYSSNAKLDGRHRTIRVRVKRPGVDIRARQGYRAATAEEIAAATPPPAAATAPVSAAMGALARMRPDAPLHIRAVRGGPAEVWVAGELPLRPGPDAWSKGGTAEVEVIAGAAAGAARVTLGAGERAFLVSVKLDRETSGAIDVQVRASGLGAASGRLTDDLRLDEGAREALLFRRGPATGNRVAPAASLVFSRSERLRVDAPAPAGATATARVLDRTGNGLALPVTLGERADDRTGQRWVTADLALAPLAPGDYVVEIVLAGERPILTAIRVVR